MADTTVKATAVTGQAHPTPLYNDTDLPTFCVLGVPPKPYCTVINCGGESPTEACATDFKPDEMAEQIGVAGRAHIGGSPVLKNARLVFYDELEKQIDTIRTAMQAEIYRLDDMKEALANHIGAETCKFEHARSVLFPTPKQVAKSCLQPPADVTDSYLAPAPASSTLYDATLEREQHLEPFGSPRRPSELHCDMVGSPRRPSVVSNNLMKLDKVKSEIAQLAGARSRSRSTAMQSRYSKVQEFMDNVSAQRMALDSIMGVLILINSLLIGVSSDVGDMSDWIIVDTVFASIFLIETLIKLRVYGLHGFFRGSERRWNLFELALVVFAWAEVVFEAMGSTLPENANLLVLVRVFRLVRITRLFRVLRLRVFSDIKVMLMGTLGGMRTLLWSAVLIFWPLYVVCLVFRALLGDNGGSASEYFASMPKSFFTLFRCVVVQDCADRQGRPLFVLIADEYGWGFAVVYCILQLFMIFGLFNVIIALYVENVVAAAKSNEQTAKKQRLQDRDFFNTKMYDLINLLWAAHQKKHNIKEGAFSKLRSQLSSISSSGDPAKAAMERMEQMEITQDLFDEIAHDKMTKEILRDLDIADDDQLDLFNVLDADGSGTIDLHELREGIARLRGEARRGDIVSIRVLVEEVLQEIREGRELTASNLENEECQSASNQTLASDRTNAV